MAEKCANNFVLLKNKAGLQISIVGFGRPKFKGAGSAPSTEQKIVKAIPADVQAAIDLLTSKGYKVTK